MSRPEWVSKRTRTSYLVHQDLYDEGITPNPEKVLNPFGNYHIIEEYFHKYGTTPNSVMSRMMFGNDKDNSIDIDPQMKSEKANRLIRALYHDREKLWEYRNSLPTGCPQIFDALMRCYPKGGLQDTSNLNWRSQCFTIINSYAYGVCMADRTHIRKLELIDRELNSEAKVGPPLTDSEKLELESIEFHYPVPEYKYVRYPRRLPIPRAADFQ